MILLAFDYRDSTTAVVARQEGIRRRVGKGCARARLRPLPARPRSPRAASGEAQSPRRGDQGAGEPGAGRVAEL